MMVIVQAPRYTPEFQRFDRNSCRLEWDPVSSDVFGPASPPSGLDPSLVSPYSMLCPQSHMQNPEQLPILFFRVPHRHVRIYPEYPSSLRPIYIYMPCSKYKWVWGLWPRVKTVRISRPACIPKKFASPSRRCASILLGGFRNLGFRVQEFRFRVQGLGFSNFGGVGLSSSSDSFRENLPNFKCRTPQILNSEP